MRFCVCVSVCVYFCTCVLCVLVCVSKVECVCVCLSLHCCKFINHNYVKYFIVIVIINLK